MSFQLRYSLTRLALVVVLTLMIVPVVAQDATSRVLVPGTAVSGTLDADNVAQVYTFAGTAGQNVSITVEADAALSIVLTDVTGTPVAQSAEGAISNVALPGAGTYFVTVLATEGLGDEAVSFTITLSAAAAGGFTEPGELLTVTGLQVDLTWNSTANMDLEVRDPVGGSLFFNTPTVESGGQFGVNANSVCATLNANGPTERGNWPAGVIPTGGYEVLVYYQPLQDCPTSDPVTFTIEVTVDGTALPAFEGTLLPNQVYLASFVVGNDGTATGGLSGVRADPPTTQGVNTANATALTPNAVYSGFVTNQQPYTVYNFSGVTGQVASLSMTANSGSLDTLLLLVDPNGNVVGLNDDRADGFTDSLIANVTLVLDGTYTVIATRYGQALGGTQGGYTLTLSGELANTALQTTTAPILPNLPNGAVEVILQWTTSADLQLLVRNPVGDAVFDDRPQIPGGGTLAAQGNVNCRLSDGAPVSYIYWPEGRLPSAGPYEIEVQHQNECGDTRPVVFTLYVVVNDVVVLTATEQPLVGERYVTSFNIGVDGQVTAGEGGIFGTVQRPDATSLDFNSQLESAPVIGSDETVSGSIRLNEKFRVYVFDGEAGEVLTVGMEALNGTLDPVLFLLDQNGIQLAQNDDAPGGDTTNALISEFVLPDDGRYIIIATHFGARYGVTAGDYNLTLRLN